ncbi:MAG: transglycosylase domain-containing protein [Candidatus Saccharibacteria bacterium]|uniref:peptidoglycan glycosyltransferase n=1 Tax=Candidatus Nanosyncoccus alces TaxID=2171997 RepID=A0ABY0FLC7_9BACT|nr:transglycosylase domain-containing protein [Candidatus Nanosyncoccus alces]MDO4398862.1 transglycosylase domain-containing protein [Candidatus Saccharibacteria bacterium]RYC74538.1 Penicillin-binding protein 2D [Candidatus Nanosyncoccus alces]
MNKKKSEVILPSQTKKTAKKPKKTAKKKMNLYSSLSYKHKAKKEADARRRAEDLAKLPKDPVKRFFARLHPKRVFKWWFSKRGQKTILKTIAACILIFIIFIGGLFLYYKKDLDEIRLDEMSISETVNTYLDRNGEVLWRDTGNEDYRLVVEADEISEYMYQATVAIEDRNFYNHVGVDFGALVRAAFSTLSGHGVQGGSTLTQQLIKQVYFSDEAASANRGGLTRKIKELILAIELERMYSKDQILTMYLNQSPYGGRRNGVESAAQTYFGKHAKDLTLAESALLASIPNNPGVFNPYNEYGHEQLLWRQHYTLDVMAEMGYITEDEAEEAKQVAILDTIKPESTQYSDMLAPHFVLEVRKQLEDKYGIQTMRSGGWTIKTTLDYRAQKIAEDAVAVGMTHTYKNRSDNIALVSVDVETSQVVAMVGSQDFFNATYGELNVTTDSLIEPGSSIKPILDYTPLFMQRDGVNYGPGSVLRDENINKLYCAGYSGSCALTNATGTFYGDVTIRFSLGHSLNIAAVKALYINGIDNSLEVAHALGDTSYCENREGYGLSIAIGSGCGVKMVEHANAYASLARGGAYKDLSYVLEVKNSSGETIESWEDKEATQVVDEQVAYMISNILSDGSARFGIYAPGGSQSFGYVVPNVWTATKTGTTTTANSAVTKDSLIESYSTALSTFVWNGNHDGAGLSSNANDVVRNTVGTYMERVHKEVYEPDGRWHYGDQPAKPAGIQTLTVNGKTDIWPSWFNSAKNSGVAKEKLIFNKYNHLLASSCTPEDYKIEIEVTKTTDPMTGNDVYSVPEPYDRNTSDPCDYTPPQIALSTSGDRIIATVKRGTNDIAGYTLYVNGVEQSGISLGVDGVISGYKLNGTETSIKFTVSDSAGYSASGDMTLTPKTKVDDNSANSGN